MANDMRIHINPDQMSNIFWPMLYRGFQYDFDVVYPRLLDLCRMNTTLRDQADYNTGSIDLIDAYNILCLVKYFRLEKIAEVGTFIGNSTLSMAYGIALNKQLGFIHTCDISNAINLVNPFENINITQYQRQSSTDMLTQLAQQSLQLDFLYLDGRLQDPDLPMIDRLLSPDSIIAIDDFEGMEKGVANLMKLSSMVKFQNHVLIYPPSRTVIAKLPLYQSTTTRSLTAVLVPGSRFIFTRQ